MATATLAPLLRADGSATYTDPITGHEIIGSANGPIQLARQDAVKPEEAALDVLVKPGVGGSGVGERYAEGIIKGVLGSVILGREKGMPRKGVYVSLLVKAGGRGLSYLPALPALLQTALFSLLSASIPLAMTFTSALVAVSPSGEVLVNPSANNVKGVSSLHVLVFSSKGDLLLNESEGSFDIDTWDAVFEKAAAVCHGPRRAVAGSEGDVDMESSDKEGEEDMVTFIRETVENRIRQDHMWKIAAT